MPPRTFKRTLIKLLIGLLRFDQQHTHLLNFLDCWPFVDRRREVQQGLVIIGDRRGLAEPVLTRGLIRTILISVTLVLLVSLGYASWGMVEGLVLIPVFVAYIYFVLFARTLVLKVKQWRET